MANEVKAVPCVVCGTESHRLDWQDGKVHACDSHSKEEVAKASVKATATPVNAPPAANK